MSAVIAMSTTLAMAIVFVASAGAAQHPALGGFGSASQPAFGSAMGIAVDQGTGDVLVIDASAGSVSRFHADGTPAEFSALGSNVIDGVGPEDETPQGALTFPTNEFAAFEVQVAVDSSGGVADGDIYVTQIANHVVDIFAETGKYLGQLSEGGGTGLGEPCGVAVDSAGQVFVGSYSPEMVNKYAPSANPPVNADNTETFTFANLKHPCNISAGAGPTAGAIFVSTWRGPVTKVSAVGGGESYIVDEGNQIATTSVDSGTGHLMLANGTIVKDIDVAGALGPKVSSTIAVGRQVEGVGVNGATGHIYVSPSAGEAPQRIGATSLLEYGPLTALAPQVGEEGVIFATSDEATVGARINPEGLPTTAQVEYGLTGAYGSITSPIAVGEGELPISVAATLKNLAPNQTYHFRFRATNAVGTSKGPDQTLTTFRTQGGEAPCPNAVFRTGPAARLADCRAYEMVTPVDKNGTDIKGLINVAAVVVELNQSTPDGEKLTYTTSQGFGDTSGVPYVSQYVGTRTASGWSNNSITSTQGISRRAPNQRLELEFQLFSPDLCQSLLNHYTDPPLAPGAIEGEPNTYRRSNCDSEQGQYETLSSVAHKENPLIQGLSADTNCGVFEVGVEAGQFNLYESCRGQAPVQVNILPDGSVSTVGTAGTTNSFIANQEFTVRGGYYQNAISTDGSRIYWTAAQKTGPLYLRENAQAGTPGPGEECLAPGQPCTIPVSGVVEATFLGASPDGARAFYAQGSGAAQELYEFDAGTGSSTLIAGACCRLGGVMGVNQDATRIYFVSQEELSGHGIAGEPNLYLYDATKVGSAQYRFIGTVTEQDAKAGPGQFSMVSREPSHRVARVNPDGLHAVFASYAPLTGYNNVDAASGERDLEVFAYDALDDGGTGSLTCLSCNPSGQRPTGRDIEVEAEPFGETNWAAAFVPPQNTSFYATRAIAANGSRAFFNSFDALLPADTNGKEDVYEWEAPGTGPSGAQCTEASASFFPQNGGCLTLISSGESPSDSEFVDASPDGRDVFFKTASSLVPQDPGLIDIYDAREGGGFPSPPGQPTACEGEACQTPGLPPSSSTASSATFNGPGNVKPHKKKHHKKKQHKKKKHHKKKSKNGNRQKHGKGRASKDGRAGR
jgi:hypothetical protein